MQDKVRRLIAENKRTRAEFLDLGNCGLRAVPEIVGELYWLQSLNFAGTWIEWDNGKHTGRASRNPGDPNSGLVDAGPLAALTNLRWLILRHTSLSRLDFVTNLVNLTTLDVSGTPLADLTPLTHLKQLVHLNVSNTGARDARPLASLVGAYSISIAQTSIAELDAFAGLTALRALDVSSTAVVSLAPLSALAQLETLDASLTGVRDLAPLSTMTGLRTVRLAGTAVTDLGPVAAATALEVLDVSRTQIRNLEPLAGLRRLRTLRLERTRVEDLSPVRNMLAPERPVRWEPHWQGNGVYVDGCPLVNPPPSIVRQGYAALVNYFRERDSDQVDHLYEAKLLVVGEGGAGKTSLVRRLYRSDLPLPTAGDTTKGISIHRHEFTLKNGRQFRLNVWDFGGQEIYHATHQFFLTRRSLYLLLDDTSKDHKSVSDHGFKYWLELIDVFAGRSPLLIFQNEKGDRSKAIDLAGIRGQYENVREAFAGNLARDGAVDLLRDGIEFFASTLSHVGEELPARWIRVRAEVEQRALQSPYIGRQEYFEIYGRHLPFDRAKALHLSRYLHDLGVFLHFQDHALLTRTIILQNTWATEAVFRVLDDETIKSRRGRFDATDCERLWAHSDYADMHPELLALMERFELCYVLPESQPGTWLAPQLLPPTKPAALSLGERLEGLALRYHYDFLPKGMISRLTVRLHRFVQNPTMAWVTGVLFEREATSVLVEVLPSGLDIELRAKGPERLALLNVIEADLDALNMSFEGLRDKVEKRIPCRCDVCSHASAPHFFNQKALLRRRVDNRLSVECPVSYEELDVRELLDGNRPDSLPIWAVRAEAPYSGSRRIRIFLASSDELRGDRDRFDLNLRQQNDHSSSLGFYVETVRWESLFNAMSSTRLQDDYNAAIETCDIFVSLFFTKAGRFTEEEFDVAFRSFEKRGRPRVFTFFKNADVQTSSLGDEFVSLLKFRQKLKDMGHFWSNYENVSDLILQFRDQLSAYVEAESA